MRQRWTRGLRLGASLSVVVLAGTLGVVSGSDQDTPSPLKPVAPERVVTASVAEDVLQPTPLHLMPAAPQPPPSLGLPRADESLLQPWKRYAVPVALDPERPQIVIVLDDLGLNRSAARRAIALPGPLTLSFMTYAENLAPLASAARSAGHELLLHVPMEPSDSSVNPGPRALRRGQSAETLKSNLAWGLDRLQGFVGINNHMGSGFTTDEAGMRVVMAELRSKGLLFLDSRTAGSSQGMALAEELGVPAAARDIFLDHEVSRTFIRGQLDAAEELALSKGLAIAIGHPHSETLDLLEEWLPSLEKRGFQLIPISAAVPDAPGTSRRPVAAVGADPS